MDEIRETATFSGISVPGEYNAQASAYLKNTPETKDFIEKMKKNVAEAEDVPNYLKRALEKNTLDYDVMLMVYYDEYEPEFVLEEYDVEAGQILHHDEKSIFKGLSPVEWTMKLEKEANLDLLLDEMRQNVNIEEHLPDTHQFSDIKINDAETGARISAFLNKSAHRELYRDFYENLYELQDAGHYDWINNADDSIKLLAFDDKLPKFVLEFEDEDGKSIIVDDERALFAGISAVGYTPALCRATGVNIPLDEIIRKQGSGSGNNSSSSKPEPSLPEIEIPKEEVRLNVPEIDFYQNNDSGLDNSYDCSL